MLRSGFPIGLLLVGSLLTQAAGAGAAPDTAAATAVQPSVTAPVRGSLNARTLGITEAVLDYCAKADPTDAAKVHARLKQLVRGATKESLAAARKSDEYLKARSSMEDFVSKVDERNAHRLCSESAAARSK
jgi:hypothetical protein